MVKSFSKKKTSTKSKKSSMIAMELNQTTSKKIWGKKYTFGNLRLHIVIIFGLLTWQNAKAATFIDGKYYVLNTSNNTASLASATGEYGKFGGYAGDVVVPSSVVYQDVTYTVTAIQEGCFYNCKDITSLTIPASVRKISGTRVFYGCKGIKRVVLEDSDDPITIPGCVYSEQYGNTEATFHYAKLESIYVGRSIKITSVSDSDSPFYGQSELSDVIIGSKVTELPPGFINGSAISNVTIPEGVKTIGRNAFAHCPNLTEIIFPNSLEDLGDGCCGGSGIEKAYVGDNVKILKGTFHSCNNLKSVYLGSGITSIGTNTFAWSNSLSTIYLFSDNLTTLDNPGFPDGLSQIFVCNPERYQNLFQDKYLSKLIVFNNTSAPYTGLVPTLNYQNYVYGTTVEYNVPQEFVNVGSYSISIPVLFRYKTWKSQANIPVVYSVTSAQLTVIPNNISRQYGIENPELTCSFFGFKNNETAEVLTKQPNVETIATKDSPVGTYPIIVTGAEAQNYSFNYERGTLTITKANQEIEWNQKFENIGVGSVVELTAASSVGLPIKYSVTDETIAEIYSQNGKKYVEFLKPGTVSIRANQEGNENYNEADRVSKTVIVTSLVKEVILNQTSLNLTEGETFQLTAVVTPTDASNKSLEWSSTNTDVASVNENGKVTALKQGSTTIYAKTTDGSNITANCEVKVFKTVSGISLNITSASLAEGQTIQLTATVSPETADNKNLIWESSNENIAIVSDNGLVTAKSQGETTIIVKSTDGSNVSTTCNIKVLKLVNSIVLDRTSATLSEGERVQLNAIVAPELADNKTLTWSSSNKSVAAVDQSGLVTAIAKGTAVITVSSTDGSNISSFCSITVRKLVSDITLNETSATLNEGQTVQLTATVSPELADNKTLAWTSSNEVVATVNQNGLVTAVSQGSAVITVRSTDGSDITASCNITVVNPVVSITLSESELTMSAGETKVLSAIVSPDNATNPTLKWESTNTDVAKVENGIVVAVVDGEADIIVSAANYTGIEAICHVTVRTLVTEIILDYIELELKEGDSTQLTATVLPNDASDATLTWRSTDTEIATVNDGLVLAHKKGKAQIFAEATDGSGVTAVCEVSVSEYSGIENVNDGIVSVYVSNRTIHFDNVAGLDCRVIQLNGSEIYFNNSNSEYKEFSLSASGTYIVIVGSKVYKIIM